MAEGRMLKRKVSTDRRLAQLSAEALILFLMSIPQLDRDGRMPGSPVAVRGTVIPALAESSPSMWTDERVASCIAEWMNTTDEDSGLPRPLVLHYCVKGVWVCQFLGFQKNQSLRLDRERPSSLPEPPPTMNGGDAISPHQLDLGAVPGAMPLREPTPELVRQPPGPEVEVQAQELQDLTPAAVESGVQGPDARAREVRPLENALGVFEEIFRTPSRLSDARRLRLERALEPLRPEEVRGLFEERLRAGASPRSIAWFLPALEERAAEVRAGIRREERVRDAVAEAAPDRVVGRWFEAIGRRLADEDFEDVLAELGWPESMCELARGLRAGEVRVA